MAGQSVIQLQHRLAFWDGVEVDKGFLIENKCALLSLVCVRPMKMIPHQTKQSKEDADLTQKVGKTRIVIEQCNGQTKQALIFFDCQIKVQQIGLADRLFREGFLLQSFKVPSIQERSDDAPNTNRPCKAKIS